MDLSTIIGLVVAFGAILVTLAMEGGSLSHLITPSALILILGGTIGATMIGFRMAELRRLPKLLMAAFVRSEQDPQELVERIVSMAERARREGLLNLQADIDTLTDPVLAQGIQMIVDGTDPDTVAQFMETQVELMEGRDLNAASALDAAGGYAPTIGIIGTVMGLVQVLGNLAEPDKLGHAISLAFLATLMGILTANLIWLPLASKVKQNIRHQAHINRMCIAGVVGLQTGEAPRTLRERLQMYLNDLDKKNTGRRRGGE